MAAAARNAQPWARALSRAPEGAPRGARGGAGRGAYGAGLWRGGCGCGGGKGPPARRPHRAPARPGRLPHLGHLEEVAPAAVLESLCQERVAKHSKLEGLSFPGHYSPGHCSGFALLKALTLRGAPAPSTALP